MKLKNIVSRIKYTFTIRNFSKLWIFYLLNYRYFSNLNTTDEDEDENEY